MNIFKRKIKHPAAAFVIIFVLAALLSEYGVVNGSLLLFDLFAGIAIYKIFTA